MATVQNVIEAIQADMLALDGMRSAPDYPPETINVFPFSVAYAMNGSFAPFPAGAQTGLHQIVVDVHVARKDLPRDVEKMMPWLETVSNALLRSVGMPAGDRFGNTIQTFERLEYRLTHWEDIGTVGWRFTLVNVKLSAALT
jgi:hypothetical protein